MTAKSLIRTLYSLLFALVCTIVSAAQQNGFVSFSDAGISIFFKTESTAAASRVTPEGAVFFQTSKDTKDTCAHRVISDSSTGQYFGYDVVVEPVGDTKKFRVSIRPLSVPPPDGFKLKSLSAAALPKYPGDMEVDEGDTIALEVLSHGATGEKVIDYITIKRTRRTDQVLDTFPGTRTWAASQTETPGTVAKSRPLAFTPDAIELRLTSPKLYVNGGESKAGGSEWGGMIEGTLLWVYVPGKARFTFSLFPRTEAEFKNNAVLDANRITFRHESESYEVLSQAAILPNGGNWKIWVHADPAYRPSSSFISSADDAVQYGATNQFEAVQAKRRPQTQTRDEMKSVYSRWLNDDVSAIITVQERTSFATLKSDAEREQFIDSFWKRRDPTPSTDDNEFRREYYSRMAYANERFFSDGKAGAQTARGKTYLQYGKPDQIDTPAGHEVWTYRSGDTTRRFDFVQESNGSWRLLEYKECVVPWVCEIK
jgi:GWxTD domain-containing protein